MGQLENLQLSLDPKKQSSLLNQPEWVDFLKLCRGSYSIAEIIISQYNQGQSISFSKIYNLLKDVANLGVFHKSPQILNLLGSGEIKKNDTKVKIEELKPQDIKAWLRRVKFFSALPEAVLSQLALSSQIKKIKAKEYIIINGTRGRDGYVLVSGSVGVFTSYAKNPSSPLATLPPMSVFGESAAVENQLRTADVVALEDSTVLKIDMSTLDLSTPGDDPKKNLKLRMMAHQVIKCHPMMAGLPEEIINLMLNVCKIVKSPVGTQVIKEGATDRNFFILLNGECVLHKKGVADIPLKRGSYFGEMAILHQVARSATVETKKESVFLVIQGKDFISLLANNIHLGVHFESIIAKRQPELIDEETTALTFSDQLQKSIDDMPAIDLVTAF